MIYGFKEYFDNRIASIITAATTIREFEDWKNHIFDGEVKLQWEEVTLFDTFQMLFNPLFDGYKYPVLIFYHTTEEQQTVFINEFGIKILPQYPARDYHIRMVMDREDEQGVLDSYLSIKNEKKTIAEILGLENEDPYDMRSDKEKEEDLQIKKKIDEKRKSGELTGDSFAGAKEQKEANKPSTENSEPKGCGHVHVSNIGVSRDVDGNILVETVTAHKWGGEIDDSAVAANDAEKNKRNETDEAEITPDDWATILLGNGVSESQLIHQSKASIINPDPKSRPSLSESAEKYKERLVAEREEARRKKAAESRKEQEVQEREEHSKEIFKGAQLAGEETTISDLPQQVQEKLKELKIEETEVLYRKYPLNSQLGNRAFLPYDTPLNTDKGVHVITTINVKIETSIDMIGVGVVIVEKGSDEGPGWVIYKSTLRSETGDIWIVEIQQQ